MKSGYKEILLIQQQIIIKHALYSHLRKSGVGLSFIFKLIFTGGGRGDWGIHGRFIDMRECKSVRL